LEVLYTALVPCEHSCRYADPVIKLRLNLAYLGHILVLVQTIANSTHKCQKGMSSPYCIWEALFSGLSGKYFALLCIIFFILFRLDSQFKLFSWKQINQWKCSSWLWESAQQ